MRKRIIKLLLIVLFVIVILGLIIWLFLNRYRGKIDDKVILKDDNIQNVYSLSDGYIIIKKINEYDGPDSNGLHYSSNDVQIKRYNGENKEIWSYDYKNNESDYWDEMNFKEENYVYQDNEYVYDEETNVDFLKENNGYIYLEVSCGVRASELANGRINRLVIFDKDGNLISNTRLVIDNDTFVLNFRNFTNDNHMIFVASTINSSNYGILDYNLSTNSYVFKKFSISDYNNVLEDISYLHVEDKYIYGVVNEKQVSDKNMFYFYKFEIMNNEVLKVVDNNSYKVEEALDDYYLDIIDFKYTGDKLFIVYQYSDQSMDYHQILLGLDNNFRLLFKKELRNEIFFIKDSFNFDNAKILIDNNKVYCLSSSTYYEKFLLDVFDFKGKLLNSKYYDAGILESFDMTKLNMLKIIDSKLHLSVMSEENNYLLSLSL